MAKLKELIAFFIALVTMIYGLFGVRTKDVRYENLPYGDSYIQNMDIYYPENTDDAVGAFLLIHGGYWTAGYKETYSELASKLAKEGYVAATMNYRKFPQGATYHEMIADIDTALVVLKEKTLSDGIHIRKAALYGNSSGGHLSLLYSYKYAADSPIPLAFCVATVAPTDLFDNTLYHGTGAIVSPLILTQLIGLPITPGNIESRRPEIEAACPTAFVTERVVPTILAYGGKDTLVPSSNGMILRDLLDAAGVKYSYFTFANSDHSLDSELDVDTATAFHQEILDYADLYF